MGSFFIVPLPSQKEVSNKTNCRVIISIYFKFGIFGSSMDYIVIVDSGDKKMNAKPNPEKKPDYSYSYLIKGIIDGDFSHTIICSS